MARRIFSFIMMSLAPLVLITLPLFVSVSLAQQPTGSQTLETSYLTMQLPQHWNCSLKAGEWVCHDQRQPKVRTAMIVVSAKEAAPEDNLEAYRRFLKQPRRRTLPSGKSMASQVLESGEKVIRGQTWIEGIHLSSELDNYYTHYLATTAGPLAILVSLSAYKGHAAAFKPVFDQAISSLHIKPNPVVSPASIPAPTPVVGTEPRPTLDDIPSEGLLSQGGRVNSLIVLVSLGLVILALVYYFRRRR